TGDDLIVRLESGDSAADQLRPGIHLHWELSDYFRRGRQSSAGGALIFPPAPNRWLVTRYLRIADSPTAPCGPIAATSCIGERAALTPARAKDRFGALRPAVAVPVAAATGQPWQWMGRVVELDDWINGADAGVDFLNRHTASDGRQLALTSVGFLGPGF